MSLSPLEYIRHIRDEVDYLLKKSVNLNFDEFVIDDTLVRAFTRSIEIIGEAAKKVPNDFKEKHPSIEWKKMAGMRDKLIHDYFGIDYELVWDVLKNKIPKLKTDIQKILSS